MSSKQIQFGMAFLHSAQLLYTDCGYPRWSVCFTLPNAIFFYMLFNDFYKVLVCTPFFLNFHSTFFFRFLFCQKSYTKKGRAKKLANGKVKQANGAVKSNGHIVHDINHNETKPEDAKKEK